MSDLGIHCIWRRSRGPLQNPVLNVPFSMVLLEAMESRRAEAVFHAFRFSCARPLSRSSHCSSRWSRA